MEAGPSLGACARDKRGFRDAARGATGSRSAVAYALILAVVWTPRPWQRVLWVVAVAGVVFIICISFDGWKAMGFRTANFWRSLWIAGAALVLAAAAIGIAGRMHTLRLPRGGLLGFIETYIAYAIWTGVQQFLLQGFFLLRFLRVIPKPWVAALTAAFLFALGAPAQSHSHAHHFALGICGVPALSSLPQSLSADDCARHSGHHRRHHGSRPGGPQHARRPRLPDLQAAPAPASHRTG